MQNKNQSIFICISFTLIILLIYLLYINLKLDVQKDRLNNLIKEDKPSVEIKLKDN